MNNYDEVIRMLRELTEELKHDNDAYDNRKEAEVQTTATTKEKEND